MKKYLLKAVEFIIHTLNNLLLLQGIYRISDKIKADEFPYIMNAIGFAIFVTVISFIFNNEFSKNKKGTE